MLVASQVIDRHIVRLWHADSPEEYVKVGIVWLTFIGLAAALADGETVRVEVLRNALPPGGRRWPTSCSISPCWRCFA